jgi:lipoprotein-releasing system permease protein
MKFHPFVARRYLSPRHRSGFVSFITLIAILGVMIGTTVLIVALAIITGFERELQEKLIGFTSHIQIQSFQNQELYQYKETYEKILSTEGVRSASPFIQREGMVRARRNVEGVLIKGIDPETDVSAVRTYVREGSFDLGEQESNRPGIIIGTKLARKLQIGLGDPTTLFALEQSEGPGIGFARASQFIVTGIYETGMAEYDDIYVFVALHEAQSMLRMDNAVSGYDVMVTNPAGVQDISEKLFLSLGYPHYPRTMYQLYRNLFTWMELQKKPIPIILGLIILVASVNIIGTMLMLVMEKTKQIGALKALGATNGDIGRIFVYDGMIIGIIGTLMGNILGFFVCFIQFQYRPISIPGDIYYMNFVPIAIEPFHYVIVSVVALLMSFLCTLIPARLAGNLDPIRTIRFA